MREIKFRAKRADTGAWVYGDLTHAAKINTKEQADESGKRSQPVLRVANYDVDENTIGQFTGLMDGNGREIYEGDIIERFMLKSKFKYQVVFNNGAFCLKTSDGYFEPLMDIFLRSTNVTGNIYDNRELKKQQEK